MSAFGHFGLRVSLHFCKQINSDLKNHPVLLIELSENQLIDAFGHMITFSLCLY